MIKVYKIKIAEKVYEVEVEAVSEKEGKIETPVQTQTQTAQPVATSGEGTPVEAPMQGLVLSIEVTAGTQVKAGDTLIVLEAMKMENPIVAPQDGVVKQVLTSKGDTVEPGDVLITLG